MPRKTHAVLSAMLIASLLAPAASTYAQHASTDTLKGTININVAGNNQDVWQRMAADYETLHPNVKVVVDLKPQDSHYADYISAGFASGTPSFDLVFANQNASLYNAGKFLDFSPYLNQPDPYLGGKPWKDGMNMSTMLAGNTTGTHVYLLNLQTVQVLWFYNKAAFAKAGITGIPTTWQQLLDACAKLKKAGYIPLALGGDYNTLWAANGGWLFRMYADQYTRSNISDERSQPGDYTYDSTIDPKWKYNAADPFNDDNNKVTVNPLRRFLAVQKSFSDTPEQAQTDRWRDDSLPIQAVDQNLHDLLAKYTPPGWYGMDQNAAYALFLQQKAGILLDGGWRLSTFDKDLKDLKLTKTKAALQSFDLGTFNNPSMTGSYVQAPARTISVAIDFYGFPKKSFAQNKLNIDFMQWFSSPQGYAKFMEYNFASPDGSLTGPPVVKNVQLPPALQAKYGTIKFIGNTEKLGTSGAGARGFDDYQPSVRTWVNLMQQYLSNKITTPQFATAEQKNVQDNFENVLKLQKLADSDLLTPAKQPPTR